MHIDWHRANFRKLDVATSNGIVLELWENKRAKLPKFSESRKPKSSFLKRLPSVMQSTNCSLQDLRMHLCQFWFSLFRLGQCVLLSLITGEWYISPNDIFPTQRTPINWGFPRRNPILQLTKSVIVDLATGFQPLHHELLLSCVWINPVGEIHYQHGVILPCLYTDGKLPSFKALSLLMGLGDIHVSHAF